MKQGSAAGTGEAPVSSAETGEPRKTFRFDDDVLISYETEGDGPAPVVFLHGFAAGLITWHDIRPLFPASLFRLYLLDLKGFGFSSKPADGRYAPEDHAAIVVSFMEELGLRHVILIGHSLGGGIALLALKMALAAGKRDLVEGLVLIDCAAYPQRLPRIMRLMRVPLLGRAILRLLPVRFMVFYSLNHVFSDKKTITSERIARYMTCFGREGIARVFAETSRLLAPAKYASLSGFYQRMDIPTLIIWGEEDRFINIRNGRRLAGEIPSSRLVVITGCGHNPHEERPAETYAAIAEYLEVFHSRKLQ
ncbi:MAG TPA: alpha/beta hydrolase [Geobacteraceae bacterium]|nr:alpha/beta hydrolase [Geobacteraceae bacterium]